MNEMNEPVQEVHEFKASGVEVPQIQEDKFEEYAFMPVELGEFSGLSPQEQCDLGNQYALGKGGIQRNKTKAAQLYTLAAERGYSKAQYFLGSCYEHAQGVQRNYEEAQRWYVTSADQDNINALVALGNCYFEGIFSGGRCTVPPSEQWRNLQDRAKYYQQDPSWAMLYYKTAVQLGAMGISQEMPGFVGINEVNVHQCTTPMAFAGACYLLATFYWHGEGPVARNVGETVRLLKIAVQQRDLTSIKFLKDVYRTSGFFKTSGDVVVKQMMDEFLLDVEPITKELVRKLFRQEETGRAIPANELVEPNQIPMPAGLSRFLEGC